MTLSKIQLLSFTLFASVLMTSCGGGNSGISGIIEGAEGETLYLERFEGNQVILVDSASLTKAGKFSFQSNGDMKMDLYRIKLDEEKNMLLMTDSTETLKLVANKDNLANPEEISGSVQSKLLHEFKKKVDGFNGEIMGLKEELVTLQGATNEEKLAFNKKAATLQEDKRQYILDFLETNKEQPVSLAAVMALNIYNDMQEYVKTRDRAKGKFDDTYYYDVIVQQINQAKAEKKKREKGSTAQNEKNNLYRAGMEAPNIVMANQSGKNLELKDLRGKIVLIDFWASWCGPCRRENPNVVRAYDEYKSKGFEVFSVSLDRDKARWEKAIEQDNLKWPNHVCDFKGWQNEASDLYGISSIPHTILIDREGTIIATKLRGAALDQKLAELFEG